MKYIAFDLETAGPAPNDGGDYALGITCAATSSSEEEEVRLWHGDAQIGCYPKRMAADGCAWLFHHLRRAAMAGYYAVAWNGLGFDLRVLAAELDRGTKLGFRNLEITSLAREHLIDPAYQMLCERGFMVGLAAACAGMGIEGKLPGMDGPKAVELWPTTRENQETILRYVAQDVRATAAVYEAILAKGYLDWVTKKGGKSRHHFHWAGRDADGEVSVYSPHEWATPGIEERRLLTVVEAQSLPLPDTAWMDDSWPRSKFDGWLNLEAKEGENDGYSRLWNSPRRNS